MSSTIATLFVLALLVLMALAGYRDGLFFSTYALVRNFIGFLCAMTFHMKLADIMSSVISRSPIAAEYFQVIAFMLIFVAVFLLGRWLKITYTVPQVSSILMVDRVAGPIVSVLNAVVVTGTVFIVFSMLPFVKFLPGDIGRFQPGPSKLDTGAAMLGVFSHVQGCMGGGRYFHLHDEQIVTDVNGNGIAEPEVDSINDMDGDRQWDRGWLYYYDTFCEIKPEDVPEPAAAEF